MKNNENSQKKDHFIKKNAKKVNFYKINHFIFNKNIFYDKKSICIFLIVLALGIFGCLMVYSASYYSAGYRYDNPYFYLNKQIIGVVLGTISMLIISRINYEYLKKFKWWGIIIALIILCLVFIPGIGVEKFGANRWLNLGIFTIQPSEIAKFAFVLFAAAYLSDNYDKVHKFKNLFPVLGIGLAFCALIILEPNMSITMCMGLIMLFMLFIGGSRLKHFALLSVPAIAAVPALIIIEPYRIQRFVAFLNPWANPQAEGYQLIQSLYSLGSGGLFGVGLFNSRQKFLFLPFSESDFIFSIIGEEFGFVGTTIFIIVMAVLILLLVNIAKNAKDRFGALLVLGIASVIAIQVVINLCVVTGLIPPTGLPLPFISSGGTSLIVFMSAIGICLNVHRRSHEKL
ncbi:MAG: putative lipid II flippase FtsW [Clostridia bacterium]|nr:putative lipid II flippase FtsW [Clostridia bacterium]